MKQVVLAGVVTALLLGAGEPVTAQGFVIYMPPNCELDTQHFLVRNAELYVKAATEARSDEQRTRSIGDAKRVLMDALDGGELSNPGVWYFLGRTYALEEDLAGADSAFAKAEELYPACGEDIDNQRRALWVPLYNQGAQALQAGDLATARDAFAKANQISNKESLVPFYLASVMVAQGDVVNAIPLFKKVVGMGQTDEDHKESYETSLFNAGRLYHMRDQFDSAAVWYAKYREVVPNDAEAITGLHQVLEAAGHEEEALAFTDTLLAYADLLTDVDLFSAGVSLFQADRFERAIDAFRAGLEKNPNYRDGVYNLAQSYFALANPGDEEDGQEPSSDEQEQRREAAEKMLEVTQRLVELDPANESSVRLLAAAYQLTGDTASTLDEMERVESMPFSVQIRRFQRSDAGARVQGTITNLKEEEITVPDLTFELLNVDGDVVARETVAGTTVSSGGSTQFQFTASGEGIAAWRYRVNE
jgi:tetratricopeptide (TPR) repeat protein